jgi:hypothetical protein
MLLTKLQYKKKDLFNKKNKIVFVASNEAEQKPTKTPHPEEKRNNHFSSVCHITNFMVS